MGLGEVVVLGLTQGLTEFLPVSSSGHLLAVRLLFGISDMDGTAFDAFLHLGTLCAVLLFFWRVWWGILRGLVVRDDEGRDKKALLLKLVVATVPGAAVGFLFKDVIESVFRTPFFLAMALLVTALALWLADVLTKRVKEFDRADLKDAWYIGLAQVLALVPGVSRSGMTIAAGRWRGLSRKQATKFSFLMSAPIIAGAGLASVGSLLEAGDFPLSQLVAGFVMAFVSGLAAIYLLLKVVERISFLPFVVYLVLLAATVLWVG